MKKYFLLAYFLLALINISLSQGIYFEQGSFEEALAKAKETGKLLFIDIHTSWCAPCKRMAQEVFPQVKVGRYFNEHFINYKQDGEKGIGPELMKKFDVHAVPTYLFLDGNGHLIFQMSGFFYAKQFLEAVSNADLYAKYGGMDQVNKYKAGSGSVAFFADYYEIAPENEKPEILNRYLMAMTDEQLQDIRTAPLVMQISLYNKELFLRIARTVFNKPKKSIEYDMNYCIAFMNKIITFLQRSILQGNAEEFQTLLEIKDIYNKSENQQTGEYDMHVSKESFLSYASPEILRLWFDCQNKCNEEVFKKTMPVFVNKLIAANPIEETQKVYPDIIYQIKHPDTTSRPGRPAFPGKEYKDLLGIYQGMANFIIEWTDYYWRISPSDKATRRTCIAWLEYACELNPYASDAVVAAAPLLVRLKRSETALAYVRKAIQVHQEWGNPEPKAGKALQETLRDLENHKL